MHIGIISASNVFIEKIIQITKTIPKLNSYQFHAFPYSELTEIPHIIEENTALDGWLFSGPNPYTAAKATLRNNDNAVFCHVTGDEVYKHLLTYIYQKGTLEIKTSIDCPVSDDTLGCNGFIEQLSILNQHLFFREYSLPFNIDEIVNFHKTLWQQGKTTIAMTTLEKVYVALLQHNIPAERLYASNASIRHALRLLDQKLTGLYFKSTQVGLAIFKLSDYSSLVDKVGSSYKLQKLDLELKNLLLDLSQEVNGYLADKGNGYYEIFASRGLLEESTALFSHSLNTIKATIGLTVTCGIGFGNTVFTAQLNAHRSLSHQATSPINSLIIVDESGQITEYQNTGTKLTYRGITEEPDLVQKLKTANVTITTYNKIIAVINKLNLSTFTAAQLSQQLNVTDRNIQRILVGLSKSGLVTCVGQETLNKRGRPTKIYQLN